jgi:hypothetical protein
VDERIPGSYGEDYDWLLRAAKRMPIVAVEQPLADVYWPEQSFFAGRWEAIAEALSYLLSKHPELEADQRGDGQDRRPDRLRAGRPLAPASRLASQPASAARNSRQRRLTWRWPSRPGLSPLPRSCAWRIAAPAESELARVGCRALAARRRRVGSGLVTLTREWL